MLKQNINSFLFRPVPNTTLPIFRIVFGLVAFSEGAGALALGWVKETFVDPSWNFTFIGFEWLLMFKGPYMYLHYTLIALFGLGIMLGYFYRLSTIAFFVFWTISYLMQKQHYNNHYYLMMLLAAFMIFVPAHKNLSLDVKYKRVEKEDFIPYWTIFIFLFQFGIIYFYAAIAKVYPDWLEAKPLTIWLQYKKTLPVIGPYLAAPSLPAFLSYSGIFYDLLVIPLLLFRSTRWIGIISSLVFHLFNSIVFQIGTFPYLMLGAIVLFYEPEALKSKWFKRKETSDPPAIKPNQTLVFILACYFLIQIILPVRHWFYQGNVHWTEEGHRLSWHMMLRAKTGNIYFKVRDKDAQTDVLIDPINEGLNLHQKRVMSKSPDMIWQFSRFLQEKYKKQGKNNIEIYAYTSVSLNGRSFQPLIDKNLDLLKVDWELFSHANWILPMKE